MRICLSHGLNLMASAVILLVAFRPGTASGSKAGVQLSGPVAAFPYDLSRPVARFELPEELDEISGLTALDSTTVAAIQDERGSIYLIDVRTGEIQRSVRFAGRGDYEAIESTGDAVYVLESNGDLIVLPPDPSSWADREPSRRIRTRLSSRFDTEGLAWDAAQGRLLIACKEYPGRGIGQRRSVYRYDASKEDVDEAPFYSMAPEEAAAVLGIERIRFADFKPSGLAVHPTSGRHFLLFSRNRYLLELEPSGAIVSGSVLERERFRQPEGIAFLPDGRLLIASEAAGGRPTLQIFSPTP
jgi:uncharacterized protein YjiK